MTETLWMRLKQMRFAVRLMERAKALKDPLGTWLEADEGYYQSILAEKEAQEAELKRIANEIQDAESISD